MVENGFITIVAAQDEPALTRSGRDEVSRVTERVRVADLRLKFEEFMEGMETVFAIEEARTSSGLFEVSEVHFSAELSASGDFKLLGTGVGVSAGTTLTFVLKRRGLSSLSSSSLID